jgi:hypothetical protein
MQSLVADGGQGARDSADAVLEATVLAAIAAGPVLCRAEAGEEGDACMNALFDALDGYVQAAKATTTGTLLPQRAGSLLLTLLGSQRRTSSPRFAADKLEMLAASTRQLSHPDSALVDSAADSGSLTRSLRSELP